MENITTSASLMCRVTDGPATPPSDVIKHISSIYVIDSEDRDVASVTAYDAAAALLDPSHVTVTGSVSALAGEGSLTLMWEDPSRMDMGRYRCVVNGIDAHGHHTEMSAELTVTSVTPTVLDLINDIKHKMDDQQIEQEHVVSDLQHEIDFLKNDIGALQQKNNQSEHAIDLMADQLKRCSESVAFHAYMSATWTFDIGETAQFQTTVTNYGNGYNNATGIFIAPREGLYFLNCNAMSYKDNYEVQVFLKVNDSTVSSLIAGKDHDNKDAATMTATVHLATGDEVKVVTSTKSEFRAVQYINVFSGHLLHADDC